MGQAVKIVDGGKLVIPAHMRRAMGIARGDTVVVELLPEGKLRSGRSPPPFGERRRSSASSITADRSLAEELTRERKQEAARE